MGLIVDAYNVLHCSHVLPSPLAMISATDLCRLIDRSRWAEGKAVVVCDGSPKPDEGSYQGSVRLMYSGPGRDADSVIEELIAADTAPRELVVVSNDRRIHKAARKRRCRVLASEQFLRKLVRRCRPPAKTDEPTPQAMGGTDEWLREFDLEDRSLEDIEAEQRAADEPRPSGKCGKHCKHPPDKDDGDARDAMSKREAAESEAAYWLHEFGFTRDREGE